MLNERHLSPPSPAAVKVLVLTTFGADDYVFRHWRPAPAARPRGAERVLDVARLTPRRRRHRPLGSTSSNAVPWKPSRDRGPIAAGQDLTSFSLSFFCTRDNLTWHAIPVVRPTNNTSTGTASPRRTAHPTATTAAADPAAGCCPVDHPQQTMPIMRAKPCGRAAALPPEIRETVTTGVHARMRIWQRPLVLDKRLTSDGSVSMADSIQTPV